MSGRYGSTFLKGSSGADYKPANICTTCSRISVMAAMEKVVCLGGPPEVGVVVVSVLTREINIELSENEKNLLQMQP